jgi:archaemetzincin
VTLAGLLIGGLFAPWLPAVEYPDGDPAPTRVAIPVSIQVLAMGKDDPDAAADLQAIRAAGRAIQPLHVPKVKPRPGDWLAAHHEPGQTFDQYRATDPNRPTARRTTLYLQPLGDFDPVQSQLIAATAELLGRFYGVPVRVLDRIGLD